MHDLKSFLPQVSKPTRYINQEINAIHKDTAKADTKVALVFPDVYEIGMSNLGLHILYNILNARDDVVAERSYAPWVDMEDILRLNNSPLCSLESSTPLLEFDIVGISLPYEMCYTNVLNILDLAHIPLRAAERDAHFPLIIGGGASVYNPEPLAEFFDFFLLGDGEEAILEIVDVYSQWKAGGGDKQSLLESLARISGGYVPSLFEPSYNRSGEIALIAPLLPDYTHVKRRVLTDFDKTPYPTKPVIPYMGILHDRINIEIARGCTRGCRFCQAGITYRPAREKSPQLIERLLAESLANSGYDEVSFSSLSVGDYSCWPQLLELMKKHAPEHISFSLPSLRPGTLSAEMIDQVSQGRKTGFTIAPEAGTERLRRVINKGITHEDIMETATAVFKAGWSKLKLYFMIGLPTEKQEDLEGIVATVEEINKIARKTGAPRPKQLNVGISFFVPKPHTPFQWWPQDSLADMRAKQLFLKKRLTRRNFQLKWQQPEVSYLEGLLARGDRKLGALLFRAWQKGAKFDAWSEHFDSSHWEAALADCAIAPDFYLTRSRGLQEKLPWEHLHTGVTKEFLLGEYERALKGEVTPDCRQQKCVNCGVCDAEVKMMRKNDTVSTKGATACQLPADTPASRFRMRAKFAKRGDLKFISHLDLCRTMIRAIRRAGLPINYSQGFHPHPKVSFSAALPVGTQSSAEYLDMELGESLQAFEVTQRLNKVLPTQLQIETVMPIPLSFRSLSQISDTFGYRIGIPCYADGEDGESADTLLHASQGAQEAHIQNFLAQSSIILERADKQVDIRPAIIKLELVQAEAKQLELELILKSQIRPQEVIRKLYRLSSSRLAQLQIERIGIWNTIENKWHTPLEVSS